MSSTATRKRLPRAKTLDNYKDLRELIISCGKSGVSVLQMEGVTIKFFEDVPKESQQFSIADGVEAAKDSSIINDTTSFDLMPKLTTPSASIQEVITSPEERAKLEQLRYDQLMLDSPIDFEQENIDRLMGNSVHA